MKKLLAALLCLITVLCLFAGCADKYVGISFNATVIGRYQNRISVRICDPSLDIGGADVYFENIDFTPKAGQAVKVTVSKNRGFDDTSYKFDGTVELLEAQCRAAAVDEAIKMYNQGATVVDARSYGEWKISHIKGAKSLPLSYIPKFYDKVLPDKNAVILVYSRQAQSSKEAAQDLVTFGYAKVYDIGSIDDYDTLSKEAEEK